MKQRVTSDIKCYEVHVEGLYEVEPELLTGILHLLDSWPTLDCITLSQAYEFGQCTIDVADQSAFDEGYAS